ncbi:MAG: dTMP kinase [Candidatus Gastranaerophilaceae bacterium]
MKRQGLFITFEGADGSGKSTQINMVFDFLTKKGIECVLTREPGGTDLGNKLRDILLNYDAPVASTCEMFLYLADRAQHVETKIKPALKNGTIVLCDRHIDSTVAYQGFARGLEVETLIMLNKIATDELLPDLTIVFDVETEIAMQRVGNNKDRLESEGYEFHKKLRHGYLNLAERFPERIKVINSNNNIQTVFNDTMQLLKSYLTEAS